MKSYYIIIRDDLNHGQEVNRSDYFDNAKDAIQWGKDEVRDVQGWFWVLEEQTRVKCEKCGKELEEYPFPDLSKLCLKCHLDKNFQSLGHYGEVPEPW